MNYQNSEVIRKLLQESHTIAVYGASDKAWRTSNSIAKFLLNVGYEVIPVNPNYETVLGMKSYSSLLDIETEVEGIWFQEGVINNQAAEHAHNSGLDVVMDRCIMKEYNRLIA